MSEGIRLPVDHCPACGTLLDAASGVRGEDIIPGPGDLSVCIRCGQMLIFNQRLRLRKATEKDLEELLIQDSRAFAALMKAQSLILQDL